MGGAPPHSLLSTLHEGMSSVSVQGQSSLRPHAVWPCPLLSRVPPALRPACCSGRCQVVSALRRGVIHLLLPAIPALFLLCIASVDLFMGNLMLPTGCRPCRPAGLAPATGLGTLARLRPLSPVAAGPGAGPAGAAGSAAGAAVGC